jgi:hypothetical protein
LSLFQHHKHIGWADCQVQHVLHFLWQDYGPAKINKLIKCLESHTLNR